MRHLGKIGALAVLGGVIAGGVSTYQHGEEVKAHEREVADKAMGALGKISPEDQAVIDAYNAMQARWDAKVKEATGGEMDLNGVKLRIAVSQAFGNLSR